MSRVITESELPTWWVVGKRRPPWWATRPYKDMAMRREQYMISARISHLTLRRNCWRRFRASDPLTALGMSLAIGAAACMAIRSCRRFTIEDIMHADGAAACMAIRSCGRFTIEDIMHADGAP